MRCFIAVDFSKDLKDQISKLQSTLRPLAASGRWKHRDNFHLTLKFLGETSEERLKQIDQELKLLTVEINDFSLEISEIGNFPGRENIRVLWLGLGGDIKALMQLQKNVEKHMEQCGFESEKRKYSPHVTIGQDLVFKCSFDEIKKHGMSNEFPKIFVDRIYLVKSEQIGNKRVYTNIREYEFGSKG